MTAQAVIFDLSMFDRNQALVQDANISAKNSIDPQKILRNALENGCHCALVSERPHREAELKIREQFGEAAHHTFSVVLTDANFSARGHKSPYAVILGLLDLRVDQAVVVAKPGGAALAATTAKIPLNKLEAFSF